MKDKPILTNIKIMKVDSETKETIKDNFSFGLYKDEKCTELIQEVNSNKDEGTVTFENLRYGIYFAKELKAPKNYHLSDKIVKIEINDKGVFVDGELLEKTESSYTFTYENQEMTEIQTGNEINYVLLISIAMISLLGIIIGIAILKKNDKNLK